MSSKQDNKNYNSHLTLEDRIIIQNGCDNGSSKASIAEVLGRDKSTIGKEIKLHRTCSHKCSYPIDCTLFPKCKNKNTYLCSKDSSCYVKFKCSTRDRSPGVCNSCSSYRSCHYDKFRYDASLAHKEYKNTLVDSRIGVNLTYNELKVMADIVVPLISKGHSPFAIVSSHPELNITEKTLYNYIEDGIFSQFGITTSSLKKAVSRKISKKKANTYKKRKDNSFLKGRKYSDYQAFISENPDASVVMMDTVYNSKELGPFIQTFKFVKYHFLLCLYHEVSDSASMKSGIDFLEEILGKELFKREVQVLLTDRGSEFSCADAFENSSDGTRRTRVYYCDPMASYQKGSLENNHHLLRDICPKGYDLRILGLDSQKKADLITSHIGSYPLGEQNGKTPFEILRFFNPEFYEKLKNYGIEEINRDDVTLAPSLLKK